MIIQRKTITPCTVPKWQKFANKRCVDQIALNKKKKELFIINCLLSFYYVIPNWK